MTLWTHLPVTRVNSMPELEAGVRSRAYEFARVVEMALYAVVGVLLSVGAAAAVVSACAALWRGISRGNLTSDAFGVLGELLLVLIFAEILHTVRISIRSESLVMEPFLVVGLIASVRRVLVITLQAAKTLEENQVGQSADKLFRNSMIELGLLGVLIVIFVVSIRLLRMAKPRPEETLH